MTDLFKTIENGFNKLGKATQREFERIGEKTSKNVAADFDQVARGMDNGGIAGFCVELADVTSMGHQGANMAENFHLIGDDPRVKEGLSAGINLTAGLVLASATGMPVFALGGAALAAKDVADMCGNGAANPGPMAPAHGAATPRQGAEAHRNGQSTSASGTGGADKSALKDAKRDYAPGEKKEALKEAKEAARREAIEDAKAMSKAKSQARRDGYAAGYEAGQESVLRAIGCDVHGCNELIESIEEHYGKDKTDEVSSRIDELLNDPNLCFEDMIFALMKAIMKDSQDTAKGMADELRGSRNEEKALSDKFQGDIDKLTEKIKNEPDQAKKNDMQNELQNLREKRASEVGFKAEGRNQIAEDLKNLMQKLSEMQQAMSNILNNQHESAMAAIRAIR